MLRELRIQNVALVDELHVELGPGFNALTGETGAGKSIIVGSIEFVLGARADARSVRTGAAAAIVDAVFELNGARDLTTALAEFGLPADDEVLILHREFTTAGRNKCHVNGSPANVAMLKQLGDLLVDFHGQHDHQILLRPGTHLDVVDDYAGLANARAEVTAIHEALVAKRHERDELAEGEREKAHQLDLYRFQIDEIRAVNLEPGEDEALRKERRILANAETLHRLLSTTYEALTGDDDSAMARLNEAARAAEEAGHIDEETRDAFDELRGGIATIEDVAAIARDRREAIEFDPVRFELIEERLALIAQLKRKYGNTIEEILAFAAERETAVHTITHRDEEVARLNSEIATLETTLRKQATELSRARKKAAKTLAANIQVNLRELGMAKGRFDIAFREKEPGPTGLDDVEFRIAPNVGEELKSLRAIASSGEISRTMLAIKSVLASRSPSAGIDRVPVLVFDEVDVNIGGETAAIVGRKLGDLGDSHQVLCITHLAQVASRASTHLAVYKKIDKKRTLTKIKRLSADERVTELARMLGGEQVSSETKRLARELLKNR